MRIGYFGSPAISAELLQALQNHFEIVFIVSNPDKATGRSKKPVPTSVSEIAIESEIPLFRPQKLTEVADALEAFKADVFMVFAYGKIIPESIFSIPEKGSFNLHASLLPDLRGASPVQTAILKGYSKTGWTFQKVAAGLDSGDILSQTEVDIEPEETSGELLNRMLPAGISLVKDTLENLAEKQARAVKQDDSRATHCSKITKESGLIDWSDRAIHIHNRVRAYLPSPGTFTYFEGKRIKLLKTRVVERPKNQLRAGATGQLMAEKNALYVFTGSGLLEIQRIQIEGKKPVSSSAFLNGHRIGENQFFGGKNDR